MVSVWIVDKRTPSSMGSGARWDAVVDLCRKDASALTRLKHPAIVKARVLCLPALDKHLPSADSILALMLPGNCFTFHSGGSSMGYALVG